MLGFMRQCCTGKLVVGFSAAAVLMLGGVWKLSGQNQPPVAPPVAFADAATPASITPAQQIHASAPVAKPRKVVNGKGHERPDETFEVVLRKLHSDAYTHFINSPGMGISRLKPVVNVVKREWQMPEWTSEELAKEPPVLKGAKDLGLIHGLSLRSFGNSNLMTQQERLMYDYKNPLPKRTYLWEIKSLDLVGLLMHENPIVYVSDKVPEMKNLKNTPTRDLDLFESEGLEELAAGKELYLRSKGETIRALGPIKAGKACLKCHNDAKEGALLGAFSYTLRPGQYLINGRNVPATNPKSTPAPGTPKQ